MRVVVLSCDGSKPVIKSTLGCDQGLCGSGNGSRNPAGRCLGDFDWEHTAWINIRNNISHQNFFLPSVRVRWIPGCLEFWKVCVQFSKREHTVVLSGESGGTGSDSIACWILCIMSNWTGTNKQEGSRMGSGCCVLDSKFKWAGQWVGFGVLGARCIHNCEIETGKDRACCEFLLSLIYSRFLWSVSTKNGCWALLNQCLHFMNAAFKANSSLFLKSQFRSVPVSFVE